MPTKRVPVYDNYVYLTADIVLFAVIERRLHVLLIRRSYHSDAYPGRWALPGGYVDAGERIDAAARRELAEETGLTAPPTWRRTGVYDDPNRDPRDRVVSVAFAAVVDPEPPTAGDDAIDATWAPVDGRQGPLGFDRLAFDHWHILVGARRELGV